MDITVSKHRGGLLITAIYRGEYYKRLYFDFTRAEAKADFRQYVREQDAKIIRHS